MDNNQTVFVQRPEGYGEINDVYVGTSGGRTSAFMAVWMLENRDAVAEYLGIREADLKYHFVFANTGQEHDDTLRFLEDLNREKLGGQLVMVEAVINTELGVGVTHKITTYADAHRWDEYTKPSHPYLAQIKKEGIPNNQAAHCTKAIKMAAITSYLRSAGLKAGRYHQAIGIRSDEARRVSKKAEATNIIYPLIDIISVDKEDVLSYWEDYEWDLAIPEHLGNCITCFKKADKKLYLAYKDNPKYFDFFAYAEKNLARCGARYDDERRRDKSVPVEDLPDSVFFRGARSTQDMIKLFEVFDESGLPAGSMVEDGGCSESCELYQMELIQ